MNSKWKIALACIATFICADIVSAQGNFFSPTLETLIKALWPTAATMTDNTTNPSVTKVANYNMCWDASGTNWDRCNSNQDGSHGSTTQNGGPRSLMVASSSVIAGTPVSNAMDVHPLTTLDGAQINFPFTVPQDYINESVTDTTGSPFSIVAAIASTRIYITSFTCLNSHATTTAYVDITDGSGGTIKQGLPCPPTKAGSFFPFPTPLKFSTNTAVYGDVDSAVTTIRISYTGFKLKIG